MNSIFLDLDLTSSIETLPAVVLASSSTATPALKTITETYTSTELQLKTSVLPLVLNGKTKLQTLTQSFKITRLIEAVKTVPPFEFINPTSAFTDLDNVLEEAGSEKREQLLPGELNSHNCQNLREMKYFLNFSPIRRIGIQ